MVQGSGNAFDTKLNPDGSALLYSTYFGGSSESKGLSIAIDTLGNAYIYGDMTSVDFPFTFQ
jgi:hypothetical protein